MGTDLGWLSTEAKNIHAAVESFFFALITTLVILGVIAEYFKLSLGNTPSFSTLIVRALIAVLLVESYPLVANTIADVSDALAMELGDLNKFNLIRERMGEKFSQMGFSWLSVRESITVLICYVVFVLFHFSFYVAEAFLLYTWTLLYIFSPILIALFVLPSTASATSALYRSLIEVSIWKPVWAVLATLLWSLCLSEVNKPQNEISFLSVISLVILFAASLVFTPVIVHALAGAGLTSLSPDLSKLGMGAVSLAPPSLSKIVAATGHGVKGGSKRLYNAAHVTASKLSEKYFPQSKVAKGVQALPKFRMASKRVFNANTPPQKG